MHVAASTGRMVAGRYLLQNTIGRGAMGTVWRARDTVLARDVAVKEMRLRGPVTTGSVMTEETRIVYERTLREARTAARLNHPAVVTIFDVVEADGSPWIVMELVEARSLDQVLTEDGPLRPDQAADVGQRVLGALACAHAAGILHRDVKPSNVLLGPDRRAVLTDFGIATLEGDSGLTQAGMVMGTPGFTAPERIRGDAASPASDLWSLGATLYAAVEGRGPFDDRGNSIAILAAIANEESPRPRSAGPLRPVIEALLHRDPQARPDAAAVSRLLAAAGNGAETGTARETRTARGTGRQAAAAGPPLLTAPLGLATPGPDTGAPAGAISQTGAPWPASGWPGTQWPDSRWAAPEDPWPERPGTGGPGTGRAWPGDRPETADAPWASRVPPADVPPAAVLPPGRHGAAAPVFGRGRRTELAAMLPRGRRGLLVIPGALAIVAVGILAGIALTRGGSGSGVPAAARGAQAVSQSRSAPGFRMAVPAGWQTSQQGSGTKFASPAGGASILVTPAVARGDQGLVQVRRRMALALKQGRFPGYVPIGGRPLSFRGGAGMAWQFTWQPASGGRVEVLDIAFRLATPGGARAYRVQESAPAAAWAATQPAFRHALSTFRPRS